MASPLRFREVDRSTIEVISSDAELSAVRNRFLAAGELGFVDLDREFNDHTDAVVLRLENRGRATVDDPTVIVNGSIQTVHMGRVRPQMIDRTADAGTKETDQEQAETDINIKGLMAHVIATSSADVVIS